MQKKKKTGRLEVSPDAVVLPHDELLALHCIVTHFMLTEPERFGRSEIVQSAKLADHYLPESGTSTQRRHNALKLFDNFRQSLSPGCAYLLKAYFDTVIEDTRIFMQRMPSHVLAAIRVLYGRMIGPPPELSGIGQIVSEFSDVDDSRIGYIRENYASLWTVIRYSAHRHDDALISENGTKVGPRVIRALMNISASDEFYNGVKGIGGINPTNSDETHRYPSFDLVYKPRSMVSTDDVLHTKGIVMPIRRGNDLLFFGHEAGSDYPLIIMAQYNQARVKRFSGLVMRKHETGHIFSSKVAFWRVDDNEAATELASKAGIYSEEDFIERFSDEFDGQLPEILKGCENVVNAEGKGGLLM